MKSVVEKIYENSSRHPDRLAAVLENEELTYKELWDKTVKLAAFFKSRGLSESDRVIFQASYSKWYVIACYAVHLCHAIFVPIDKNSSEEAVNSINEVLDAKCVVSEYKFEEFDISLLLSELEGCIDSFSADTDYTFPTGEMYADIMFTTGTTGKPKGVVLTHDNLSATCVTRIHEILIRPDNVGITFVPLNHVAPMRELYLNGYNGSTAIFLDGMLKIKKMFEYMKKYGVTSLYIPPSGISVVSRFSANGLSSVSDQLDYVYSASSNMTEVQQEYMRESLPNTRLYFSYGSSENGSVSLHRYLKDRKEISCVGKPCEGVSVRIVDQNNEDVPTGEIGTVTIRSAMNFPAYWRNPEITEKVYKDGYFISNDAGYFDNDGYLYIVGRKDDLVNIGGLKVYPAEIEDEVAKIDGVEDCICVAVPDAVTGQAIRLIVKKAEGSSLDAMTVKNNLTGKVDSYKIPKIIEFADHIERTSNGKLNRKAYR